MTMGRRGALGLLAGALAAPAFAQRAANGLLAEGGFDRAAFDAWVSARAGDGKPVFWYSEGTVRSLYSGELLAFMEGYDTAVSARPEPGRALAHQYNRKHYIYRDPATGAILGERGGVKLEPTAYPYQFISYELVGDRVHTIVEQGTAPRVQRIGPGTNMACRRQGDTFIFTAPVFLDFPAGPNRRYQAFENYDFVVGRNAPPGSYALSWLRTGDAPAGLGGKPSVMHLVTRRFERFEDVPARFRDYIAAEAPLWRAPPADLAEIRRLQGAAPAAAGFGG